MALSDNLISWWELNETSGTRVDAHGSYDLTDNNTVGNGTGKQGNCADFIATNSEYLSSGTGFGTALGSSVTTFSMSFWFNADITSGNDGILSIGNFSNTQGEFNVHLSSNNLTTLFDNGASTSSFGHSDTTNWHHYAVSYNGSSYTIWLDNVKKHTAVSFSNTLNFSGLKMILGGYYNTPYTYDGLLDEVGVWDKALSDAEVAELYNSGSGLAYADLGGSTDYPLTASLGTFTLTGVATAFSKAMDMVASAGSFVLTGISATLLAGASITASAGSFVLTGTATTFSKAVSLVTSAGAFTLTGIAVVLTTPLKLLASVGSFVLTGVDARLRSSNIVKNVSKFVASVKNRSKS